MNNSDANGKNGPLEVRVGLQHDGAVYGLSPSAERRVRQFSPNAKILPVMLLGYDGKHEFPDVHERHWDDVVSMISGLTSSQVEKLGGYRLVRPESGEVIYDSTASPALTR